MVEREPIFRAGQQCGPFTIDRLLSQEPLVQIYAAVDPRTKAPVLLTCAGDQGSDVSVPNPSTFMRWLDRVRAFDASGQPRTLDGGITGYGVRWTATEVFAGSISLLKARAKSSGKILTVLRSLAWVTNAARLLDFANDERGILHGDLSPSRIRIAPSKESYVERLGHVQLFGLDYASIVATPRYRSPEQLAGEAIDARSDQYSLGMVLHELIAGEPPFADAAPVDLLRLVQEEAPRPLTMKEHGCPPEVADYVFRAIAKDPAQRFESWGAFVEKNLEFVSLILMLVNSSSLKSPAASPEASTSPPAPPGPSGRLGAREDDAPESDAPESDAPESNAPESNAPESDALESHAPANDTPENDAPESDAPESDAPESDAPAGDALESDASANDRNRSDAPWSPHVLSPPVSSPLAPPQTGPRAKGAGKAAPPPKPPAPPRTSGTAPSPPPGIDLPRQPKEPPRAVRKKAPSRAAPEKEPSRAAPEKEPSRAAPEKEPSFAGEPSPTATTPPVASEPPHRITLPSPPSFAKLRRTRLVLGVTAVLAVAVGAFGTHLLLPEPSRLTAAPSIPVAPVLTALSSLTSDRSVGPNAIVEPRTNVGSNAIVDPRSNVGSNAIVEPQPSVETRLPSLPAVTPASPAPREAPQAKREPSEEWKRGCGDWARCLAPQK